MKSQASATSKSNRAEAFNDLIIDSIQDIKGKQIVKLDLRKLEESPADFFIICQGDSTTQVQSIASNIHKRVKEEFQLLPSHTEGRTHAHWICLDYFNTVVHVFYPDARDYYGLEQLWNDADVTEYASL